MQVDDVRAYVGSVSWNRLNAGKEAEGPMQCYIGIEFTVDGPLLLSEMSIEDPPQGWKKVLWDKNGKPRELCLKALVIDREFTGLETVFRAEQTDLFGEDTEVAGIYSNVRKIVVYPEPGNCLKVKCQLQIEPSMDVWDHLIALMKRWVFVSLTRVAQVDPEDFGEETQEELQHGDPEDEAPQGAEEVSEGAEGSG